jgi:hypothetical protein
VCSLEIEEPGTQPQRRILSSEPASSGNYPRDRIQTYRNGLPLNDRISSMMLNRIMLSLISLIGRKIFRLALGDLLREVDTLFRDRSTISKAGRQLVYLSYRACKHSRKLNRSVDTTWAPKLPALLRSCHYESQTSDLQDQGGHPSALMHTLHLPYLADLPSAKTIVYDYKAQKVTTAVIISMVLRS